MLPIILFLCIVVPITELGLLFFVSKFIGFWTTIGIIIGTGLLGGFLLRFQGKGVFDRLRNPLAQPMNAGDNLLDGAMIFFAGGLLLTPGLITDLLGLLLLIPWSRSWFKSLIWRGLKKRMEMSAFGQAGFNPFTQFGNMQNPETDMENDETDPNPDDFAYGNIIEGFIAQSQNMESEGASNEGRDFNSDVNQIEDTNTPAGSETKREDRDITN